MEPERTHVCAILKVLVNKHCHGGAPLPKDAVVSFAAVPSHALAEAKQTFDILRTSPEYPFVSNEGADHILLDNGAFPELVDFLYHECGWSAFKIDNSLRHYDVTDHHDFG